MYVYKQQRSSILGKTAKESLSLTHFLNGLESENGRFGSASRVSGVWEDSFLPVDRLLLLFFPRYFHPFFRMKQQQQQHQQQPENISRNDLWRTRRRTPTFAFAFAMKLFQSSTFHLSFHSFALSLNVNIELSGVEKRGSFLYFPTLPFVALERRKV